MPTATSQRDERIDLRVSADLKSLLSRAASYSGMSLSSFLVSTAADCAKEVVAEHETLTLPPATGRPSWQPSTIPTGLGLASRRPRANI
jgi:uncharacterized protein (DUF1778 family)